MIETLAGYPGALRWIEDRPDEPATAVRLRPHLDRFYRKIGGPWQAACSLWGQIYANTLLIPALSSVASRQGGDLVACRLCPMFCAERGTAASFLVYGERGGGRLPGFTFLRLIETHMEEIIDQLAQEGALSRRMLWEGAEQTLRWASAQISEHDPLCASRMKSLALSAKPGSRLAATLVDVEETGAEAPRRLCCLRYRLDGFDECPRICPRLRGLVA